MNATQNMTQTTKTLAFALSLLPAVGYGQASDTNVGSATSSRTTQKVEGAVTNNVRGTLTIEWPEVKAKWSVLEK